MEKGSTRRPHALVIGAGVSGLTTAWVLLDRGYKVSVLAKQYASEYNKITSQIAGALWEWPPAVCGHHTDKISLAKSKAWCMTSYERFNKMADDTTLREETGVRIRMSNFFFTKSVKDCAYQVTKMEEIKANVKGFRHDPAIINELNVNPDFGVVDAYQHLAPVIDTDQYMKWLTNHVATHSQACLFVGSISSDLLDCEDALLQLFDADVLVNCTGLAATELAQDRTMHPLRGAYVRVINDGTRFPQITQSMCLSLDGQDDDEQGMVFIVPRNDHILILGGMVEVDKQDLNIDWNNYPPLKAMYDRDLHFYTPLHMAELDPSYPIAVGLRPFRTKNIRVEREHRPGKLTGMASKIIHNYGHGGSGFTLSFGCAEDVATIADTIVSQIGSTT